MWAATLLRRLGIHQTPGAVQGLVGWSKAEGGHWNNDARYNPLNTTQGASGAKAINGVGVKSYGSWQQGLDATVETLHNGHYGGILKALQSGSPDAVASAIGKTPWGTNAGLAAKAIASTPRVAGVHAAGIGDGSGGAARAASVSSQPETALADMLAQPPQPQAAGAGVADLLGQLQVARKPAPVQSMGVQAPSFSAAPALPQGYQQATSGGGAPGSSGSDNLAQLLQSVSGLKGQDPTPVSGGQDAGAQGGSQASPSTTPQAARKPGAPITDVKRLLGRAAAIDSQELPYVYGGGHGAKASKPGTPLDCSSAVSKVLGIDPRVSGDFERFGSPGRAGKGGVTIYANKGHVLMEIDGRFWGTSGSNPGGGAGWIDKSQISPQYLKGFTARHLAAAR